MLRWVMIFAVVLSSSSYTLSDSTAMIEEQFEASGAQAVEDAVPDYARDSLEELGMELNADIPELPSGDDAAEVLLDIAAENVRLPIGFCCTAAGIIILCALSKHTAAGMDGLGTSFDTISSAAAALTVCIPVATFIDGVAGGIADVCSFGAVLIPVLSGLAAVNGSTASAAACSSVTLAALETVMVLMPSVLIPILRVLLGISMVSSLCGFFDLGRLTSAVDKALRWLLGLAGVFLSGVLSISAVAASAADSAAARTTRFVLSGAVPVVGGVISEAIGTITNCVGIIRGSVGAFGIIAGLLIVLPAVILAVLWLIGLNTTAWIADGIGAERTAAAVKAMSSVVSLALGLIAFAAMTVTCSAALIMNLRSG